MEAGQGYRAGHLSDNSTLSLHDALPICFPKEEVYGLVSQMRRASVSIPSNVAEGFKRFHNKEYRQLLYVALGSCAELETHVEITTDLQYLERKDQARLIEKLDHETRMLRNLIKKL